MPGRVDHTAELSLQALLDGQGFVLDVGGGGEGIIGKLCPDRVVAVDRMTSELEEARERGCQCLMATMDATSLAFLDASFSAATAFFSMMYMAPESHAKVLSEVYRVLKPGAKFTIWDLTIPERPSDEDPDTLYVVFLTCHLPNETVMTGYGVKWRNRVLGLERLSLLATETGFEVESREGDGATFRLELRKPVSRR